MNCGRIVELIGSCVNVIWPRPLKTGMAASDKPRPHQTGMAPSNKPRPHQTGTAPHKQATPTLHNLKLNKIIKPFK